MAKAYIMDFAGGTAEQYDGVIEAMDLGGRMPPGGLFHYAGPTPTGWRVIDAWADPAAFDRFAAERIMPLAAEHGLVPPEVEAIELDLVHHADGRAKLVQVARLPGVDADHYDDIRHRLLEEGRWPDVIVDHVDGPGEGGWVTIDAWTSMGARDRFFQRRVLPRT